MASWRMCQLMLRAAPRSASVPRTLNLSRACTRAMSAGGIPTDEEQATGLERKIMVALKKGEDPYNILPKVSSPGTKENPHIVPSVNKQRMLVVFVKKTILQLSGSGSMREK
ncbi:cytochrome c oxidase subunit 5B, mitochondrial [Rana temporaria]|uniref:cytochrome c oxidase subunit 5B, mitochondrial n=1 Tax=Rana temporaria TaxID=8407 RepID=UPI001AAC99BD|nr:cytochrome c oxidase subunit 5B, mitochondrial [Rana temporaria]